MFQKSKLASFSFYYILNYLSKRQKFDMLEEGLCSFPHGTVLKKKEGTTLNIANHDYILKRLLHEHYSDTSDTRTAVFEAEDPGNKDVIVKFRLQYVASYDSFSFFPSCL